MRRKNNLILTNRQRPCKECDRFLRFREKGQLCRNGMCEFTGRVQPAEGSWYCEHFQAGPVRMHPKVRYQKKRRKDNVHRRKNRKAGTASNHSG